LLDRDGACRLARPDEGKDYVMQDGDVLSSVNV
jgi:hypothetical protein